MLYFLLACSAVGQRLREVVVMGNRNAGGLAGWLSTGTDALLPHNTSESGQQVPEGGLLSLPLEHSLTATVRVSGRTTLITGSPVRRPLAKVLLSLALFWPGMMSSSASCGTCQSLGQLHELWYRYYLRAQHPPPRYIGLGPNKDWRYRSPNHNAAMGSVDLGARH
jgi:hypothetical protein